MKTFLVAASALVLAAAGCKSSPCFAQSVTVTLNGTTYTGTLSAQTPTPPVSATPQLPKLMMTTAWPLNQSIAGKPGSTQMVTTTFADPTKGIAAVQAPANVAFHTSPQFGTPGLYHMGFDTTMRITVVDTRQTPNIFAPLTLTTDWTANYPATKVPVIGCHIEGTNADALTGDRHCLIYDVATGIDHEIFGTIENPDGTYKATAYIPWDTTKPMVLPPGQTSADAAGLPILPLLLRYAEANSGNIPHALRFTLPHSRANANAGFFTSAYASHAAGDIFSVVAWMGMRIYLRPDFPTAGLSPIGKTIVKCLQTYGMVLADNGGTYITGDNDSRWTTNTAAANDLRVISNTWTLGDFTLVDSGPIIDSEGNSIQ